MFLCGCCSCCCCIICWLGGRIIGIPTPGLVNRIPCILNWSAACIGGRMPGIIIPPGCGEPITKIMLGWEQGLLLFLIKVFFISYVCTGVHVYDGLRRTPGFQKYSLCLVLNTV